MADFNFGCRSRKSFISFFISLRIPEIPSFLNTFGNIVERSVTFFLNAENPSFTSSKNFLNLGCLSKNSLIDVVILVNISEKLIFETISYILYIMLPSTTTIPNKRLATIFKADFTKVNTFFNLPCFFKKSLILSLITVKTPAMPSTLKPSLSDFPNSRILVITFPKNPANLLIVFDKNFTTLSLSINSLNFSATVTKISPTKESPLANVSIKLNFLVLFCTLIKLEK